MKGRGVFNRRGRWQKLLLTTLLAASGAAVVIAATPAPAPQPFPPILQVFKDTFNSSSTYARYTGFGGASVSISGGRLNVYVPPGTPFGAAGLKMRVPANGRGVRCSGFGGLLIPPLGSSRIKWTLIGFDAATGRETPWMELEISESQTRQDELKVVGKKNGQLVFIAVKPNANGSAVAKVQFDTKDGGKKIQAEVTFADGTRANSEWVDPDPGTIAGFDLTTDASEVSVDSTEGTEVHAEGQDLSKPAPILAFGDAALTREEPHWLIQTHDADVVVRATVMQVRGLVNRDFDGDRRPRLKVEYQLDRVLFGQLASQAFVVHHAITRRDEVARFHRGAEMLLFLKSSLSNDGAWLWDFGQPTGTIPASRQNNKAVASRIAFIHGGEVP